MKRAAGIRPTLEVDLRDYDIAADAYQDDDGWWHGTLNDAAFNAALTWAGQIGGARVIGGGNGKYLVTGPLFIPSDVTFEGDGGTIVLSGESTGQHLLRGQDAQRCKIKRWILDGNRLNRPAGVGKNVHNIRFHNCQDYEVDEVDMYRASGYGISSDFGCVGGRLTRINAYDGRGEGFDVHNSDWQSRRLTIAHVKVIDFAGDGGVPKAGIHLRGEGIDLSHFEVTNLRDVELGNVFGVLYGNGEAVRGGHIGPGRIDLGRTCLNGKGLGCHNPFAVIDGVTVFGDSDPDNPTLGTNTGFVLQSPNIRLTNSMCVGKQVFDTAGNLVSTGKTISHGVNIAVGADNCTLDGNTMSDIGGSGYFDQATGTIFETEKAINCDLWGFDLSNSTGARGNSKNSSTNCLLGDVDEGTDTRFDQEVSPVSTPRFAQATITNAPVNPQDAVNKASLEAALTGYSVLLQTGTPVVLSGTATETILAYATVPGGLMGLNGSLEILHEQTVTSSANVKTLRVRFGGLGSTAVFLSMNLTTNLSSRFFTDITNAGDAAKQSGWVSNNGTFGQSGSAPVTSTKNTLVDQDVVITGQLSAGAVSAGDILTLTKALIRFVPGFPVP